MSGMTKVVAKLQQNSLELTSLTPPSQLKPRLLELFQLFLEHIQEDPKAKALVATAPLLEMAINNYETGKLRLLLTCLGEISRAVIREDLSEDEYIDAVYPHLLKLKET